MNPRRIARELAILTLSQSPNREATSAESLADMLARAADMLATEARDRLSEAAGDLTGCEHQVHEVYLEMAEAPLRRADLEKLLAALEKAQEAAELIGSALELPAAASLAGSEETREFVIEQITRYLEHRAEVDARLQEAAKNWTVERMASLDRDIMRLAIAELLWSSHAPVEVVINEAVELAKKYGTPDSGRFVNGVLARFAGEGAALRKASHVV